MLRCAASKKEPKKSVGTLVRGDNESEVIRIEIARNIEGVDLSDFVWSVKYTNSAGQTDIDVLDVEEVNSHDIILLWTPGGAATSEPGITSFEIEGIDGERVWQSATQYIELLDDLDGEPNYDPEEMSEVQRLIRFTKDEINALYSASEAASAAAERANEAAEHVSDGATFTPSVSFDGVLSWTNDKGLTNPDPVNIKGGTGADGEDGFSPTVTVEEITGGHRVTITDAIGTKSFDVMDGVGGSGGSGSGSGDMLKSTYDTDGSGVVDDAEKLGGQPPSYYEVPKYLTEEGESYSVTGDVVTVENYGGMPMNVVTTIEPVQEGSGDPSPDNIRPITGHTGDVLTQRGKNLFSSQWTYGDIDANTGNDTSNSSYMKSGYVDVRPGNIYALSRSITTGYTKVRGYSSDKTYIGGGGSTIILISGGTNATSNNPMVEGDASCVIQIKEGVHYLRFVDSSIDETTQYQLELGSAPTEYEPYNSKTTTADFDQTVYGGTYDWNTGVLTVEWGLIISYAGETLPGEWISDRDVYAEGMTPTTGAQVCYKLAIPTTIQLNPQYIYALGGTNIIYCDAGTTTVSFSKSIFGLIDSLIKRIAALEAAVANNV